MKKLVWSRILLGIGVVLSLCYVGGILYIYYFAEYNPYASAGAEVDALIHSVLLLPPTVISFIASLILHMIYKKAAISGQEGKH